MKDQATKRHGQGCSTWEEWKDDTDQDLPPDVVLDVDSDEESRTLFGDVQAETAGQHQSYHIVDGAEVVDRDLYELLLAEKSMKISRWEEGLTNRGIGGVHSG